MLSLVLHYKWKAHFTQFALDLLPAVGRDGLIVPGGTLSVEPLFQAIEMDVLHGSIAHAR